VTSRFEVLAVVIATGLAAGVGARVVTPDLVEPQSAGQKPAAPVSGTLPTLTPTISEESMLIYQGWALIAAGDVTKASRHAADVLTKFPRNVAALSLSVEADILRSGAGAGLDVYDRWLGDRKTEEPYVLRRIARAVLWTSARNRDGAASDALKHLARDGDVEARAELTRRTFGGSLPDAKALAPLDEGAVRYLISQLRAARGPKLSIIDALVASKNRLAVAPLIELLGDLSRPDDAAAAADGLGKLGAGEAIPRLQPLAAERNVIPPQVKWAASSALYRLDDMTGVNLLRSSLMSDIGALRLTAAEAMSTRPDPTWQQAVRTLTQDPSAAIRIQAAKLIAPFDLVLARGILEPELANADRTIAAAAAQILAQHFAPDLTSLRRLLRSADPTARVIAAGRVFEMVQ
jgi:HEAT repeat protein